MNRIKRLLLLPVVVLIIGHTAAQNTGRGGIQFCTGSWQEALQKAKTEGKPIFLDVYATWCVPCKLLKLVTFKNKRVAAFYNANFINVSLDGEKEGAEVAAQLGVSAYPTLFYFDQTGQPVLYSLGYLKPSELIDAGRAALQKLHNR